MTREDTGDEAAIRAMLGGSDPADAAEHGKLLRDLPPPLPFDAATGPSRAPRPRRLPRRTRLAIVAVPVLLAGAGGVAVGWDDWAARPEYRDVVRCYTDTDLTRGEKHHGGGVGIGGGKDASALAVEMCSMMWREGKLSPGSNVRAGHAETGRPVPPLITCVVDGFVSVLPAFHGETCRSLKLRTWPVK